MFGNMTVIYGTFKLRAKRSATGKTYERSCCKKPQKLPIFWWLISPQPIFYSQRFAPFGRLKDSKMVSGSWGQPCVELPRLSGKDFTINPFYLKCCETKTNLWRRSLLNLYASVIFLEIMSIDRYLSVVYPMKMIKLRTRRSAVRICAGVWLLAVVIASKVWTKSLPSCSLRAKANWVSGLVSRILGN